jgi:hypothetical protein
MATQRVGRVGWPAERKFYTFMTLAIFAAMYVGFARSFFLRPWFPEVVPLTPKEPFFYFHGAVFTTWFVLLVLQPALVGMRRVDLHRIVGQFAAAVAAALVVVGVTGAIMAARRPEGFLGVPIPPAQFLIVPLTDMLLFALIIGAAFAKRRDAQAHKRLMLVGSICLLDAAFARWPLVLETGNPIIYFALADAFLIPLVIWDLRSRGRLHPATLWAGLLLVASHPLRLWLSGTAAWLGFAARLL